MGENFDVLFICFPFFWLVVCDLLACFYKVFADLINVSVISKCNRSAGCA